MNLPTIALQPGSTNTDAIKQLQDYLVSIGLLTQTQEQSGYGTYGPATTAAVLKLQQQLGIDYSSGPGYFGPKTISAIQTRNSSAANLTPTLPTPYAQTTVSGPLAGNSLAPTGSGTSIIPTPAPGASTAPTASWLTALGIPQYGGAGTSTWQSIAKATGMTLQQLADGIPANYGGSASVLNNPNAGVDLSYLRDFVKPSWGMVTPPITPTAPPKAIEPPSTNLQPGMTGDAVKQLQDYLVSKGYMLAADEATGPGTYGPKTTAAVVKMQQALGVNGGQYAGYFGPQTIAALGKIMPQEVAGSSAHLSTNGAPQMISGTNLESTGNPVLDSILKSMSGYIDNNLSLGNVVNPDLQITPDLVQKFLGEAHQQVDPYSQQQLTNEISGINSSLEALGKNYVYDQGNQQAQFQNALGQERNASGNNGTAFSGGRGLIEQNMLGAQNRSLGALDTRYGQDIGNKLREGANLVGNNSLGLNGTTADFKLPNLTPQTASLEGARGGVAGSNPLDFNYDPTTYRTGSLASQYGLDLTNQSNQFLSNYLKSASNNSARTFQNLNGNPTLT